MELGGEALEAADAAEEALGGGERVALTRVAVPRVVFVVAATGGMSAASGSLYKSPGLVPESRLSLDEMDGLSVRGRVERKAWKQRKREYYAEGSR